MLPTEDAAWVGAELARRFGVPYRQFALTATDANRWMIRMCRHVTNRPRIAVFNWCYHGSVDESFVILDEQGPRARERLVGPALDPTETTRVAEFNDVGSLERVLEHEDVACLLMEPALTNIGIVLPEPGYMDSVRELCTQYGTLLIIDETHTLSAGPGGCTAAWGLEPDAVTLGKSIGGGVPIGTYGVTAELAERIAAQEDADYEDTGGVGGTLAGNALSLAAARATLGEVLTDDAFERMIALRERFVEGVGALSPSTAALDDRLARRSLRVPLHTGAAAHRRRVRRRGRSGARGVPSPLPHEPRHAHHPLPQHGADVPCDDRGAGGPRHRGLRRSRGRARRVSSYERIAELPLEVESLRFEGRELQFSPEFTRATTLIELRGPGGETGVGEDVVYDELDHVNLQADGPGTIDLAGSYTLDSFSKRLEETRCSRRRRCAARCRSSTGAGLSSRPRSTSRWRKPAARSRTCLSASLGR